MFAAHQCAPKIAARIRHAPHKQSDRIRVKVTADDHVLHRK